MMKKYPSDIQTAVFKALSMIKKTNGIRSSLNLIDGDYYINNVVDWP